MRRWLFGGLACSVGLICGLPDDPARSGTGASSQILFVSSAKGVGGDVYAIAPDGSGLRRLTHTALGVRV